MAPRVRREALDAVLDAKTFKLGIERMKDRFADAAFWRELCPALTVSSHPFDAPTPPYPMPDGLAAACEESIALEGYFTTPPVVEPEDAVRLAEAATTMSDKGFPPGFAAVYDEFWRMFHRLRSLAEPLLGADPLMVPDGLWTFVVPPGDSGRSGWSSAGPHRDSIGSDPHLLKHGQPGILNFWVALTDATPLTSCMYVLPGSVDDEYEARIEPPSEVRLQDVRALPAPAGSVLGWTPHLLHWGSRSSPLARAPRVSAALYLQRREVDPFAADVVSTGDPVPFEDRLRWIAHSMAMDNLFEA